MISNGCPSYNQSNQRSLTWHRCTLENVCCKLRINNSECHNKLPEHRNYREVIEITKLIDLLWHLAQWGIMHQDFNVSWVPCSVWILSQSFRLDNGKKKKGVVCYLVIKMAFSLLSVSFKYLLRDFPKRFNFTWTKFIWTR